MSNIKPSNELSFLQAGSLIRRGGLVAFPTETVYGLGVNASNDKAVASLFKAKQRPEFNPLVLHLVDAKSAERLAFVDEKTKMLIRRFWPGSLTIVLKRKPEAPISELVSAGLDTIALRVPSSPIAHALLRSAACPVAATSANSSGMISPTIAAHVEESFGNKIDMILDGGKCTVGVESTILDMSEEQPVLLRSGVVPLEDIEAIIGRVERKDTKESIRHYAPKLSIRLNAASAKKGEALLGFGDAPDADMNLSRNKDVTEAAANLFAMIRELDKGDFTGIAVMPIPEEGLGVAINDRLAKTLIQKKQDNSKK
ncbi:MAG: threonylcarbamoyl-AMP synthase [Alphaproteobacteria bacterium]|nr:threonylcarbamoyl-AMP synthase [Alphaproteobacteria bacterium]